MIEHQLTEFLRDDTDIRDRVSGRIYPGRALQGTRGEMLIVRQISRIPTYTIDLEAGVDDQIIQIDCYAASPRSAFTIAELVRTALSGYRGNVGTTTPVRIQSCRIISAGQQTERPSDKSDRWIHRYQMDFAMFVTSTIPTFV